MVREVRLPSGALYYQEFNGAGWQLPQNSRLFFGADGFPTYSTAEGKLYYRYKTIPYARTPAESKGYVWIYGEPAERRRVP